MLLKLLVLFSSLLSLGLGQGQRPPSLHPAPNHPSPGPVRPPAPVPPPEKTDCCCYHVCPSGWTRFQDRCYKFYGGVANWYEAEGNCTSKSIIDPLTGTNVADVHLTSINSQEEQDFVFNLWQDSLVKPHPANTGHGVSSKSAMWIGAYKNLNTSEWGWTDGIQSWGQYTAWDQFTGITPTNQQPDNTGNCVHMWTKWNVNPPGGWNDMPCTTYMGEGVPITYTCETGLIKHCE